VVEIELNTEHLNLLTENISGIPKFTFQITFNIEMLESPSMVFTVESKASQTWGGIHRTEWIYESGLIFHSIIYDEDHLIWIIEHEPTFTFLSNIAL